MFGRSPATPSTRMNPVPHRPSFAPHARLAALVALLVIAWSTPAAGQQAARHDGYQETVRLENERVRVLELRYAPGGAAPLHTHHFPRVVYVVEGGVLELVPEAGTPVRLELSAGQTLWRPAETHAVRNVGPGEVVVVETEVKSSPPAGS